MEFFLLSDLFKLNSRQIQCNMKTIGSLFTFFFCLSVFSQETVMRFEIDLTQNLDTIYVSLSPSNPLAKESNVFQFPATAPGTYQTMNIGRFVSNFQAFDKKGKPLKVAFKAPNQYWIEKPQKAETISYRVAETFDTKVKQYPIYLMCGSSLEEDHALINTHTLMGYFHGFQQSPIELKVIKNEEWKEGTALMKENDLYLAKSFDHIVDSPLLLGDLSYADTLIANTKIEIYTYSRNNKIESQLLLSEMSDMLDAARKFLVNLPVDRYTFLYHFEPDQPGQTGAWEHSYSSEYVLNEEDPTPEFLSKVTDIASHEFFHIVTPLNIHSEIIESFNFVEPTPSIHLWLYEGVTEWASNILLYRGEVVDLESYLSNAIARKIQIDRRYFNRSWSLKKLAQESFNEEGAKQYGNIYFRGSLVAGLMDILLLDLSDGEYGLRELVLDLVEKYGKGKPISEDQFFDELATMTYPELRTFVSKYILESEPLPHAEYLAKIGIVYNENEGKVTLRRKKKLSEREELLFNAWSQNLSR